MSDPFYIGADVTAVPQVDRFTPANVEINDVFTLTVTGHDGTTTTVTFTATVATVANVTAGITTAWNASTHRHCTPITAADATTSMTLTADTAGIPFSVASSATDGGGANTQTFTRSAVTANVGSSDGGYAPNWSTNAVPVSSDNVTFDPRMQNPLLYWHGASGVTLATIKHYRGSLAVGSSTGSIRVAATVADINLPAEDGSNPSANFVNLNVGTVATTTSVWGSASSGSAGLEPVLFDGTHASNVLNVYAGTTGVGTFLPGDTSTTATVNAIGGNAKVVTSTGTTLTTATFEAGAKGVIRCAATTLNIKASSCQVRTEGSGAIATINNAGKLTHNSTGTVTNLHTEAGGTTDTRQTNLTRTVSNAFVYGNGKVITDLNTTYTNGIDCLRGADSEQVSFGDNVTVTASAT